VIFALGRLFRFGEALGKLGEANLGQRQKSTETKSKLKAFYTQEYSNRLKTWEALVNSYPLLW
jgi:hypothetical protein